MAKRLNTLEQIQAFLWPRIKTILGSPTPYWFYLDVTTTCNLRCGYCFVIEEQKNKIDWSIAKKSIDFMHQKGCRVMALMGGEPLLLGDSLVEIVEYATNKRMFSYLPTNLTRLTPSLLESLTRAGIGVIDVAIDSMEPRQGFGKNLKAIQDKLNMVLENRKNGVHVKLNAVITRQNINDIRQLVELSKKVDVPISFHLIEGPMPGTPVKPYSWLEQTWRFQHEDYPLVAEIADWLMKKKQAGYWIINPVWFFERMKEIVREGTHSGWQCFAGQRTIFINKEGKFAPCLALIWQEKDWGSINTETKTFPFDKAIMDNQLKICNKSCMSCGNTLTAFGDYRPLEFLIRHIKTYLKLTWLGIRA